MSPEFPALGNHTGLPLQNLIKFRLKNLSNTHQMLSFFTCFQKIPILTSIFACWETPLLVEGQNICDLAMWAGFWPDVFVPDRDSGYNVKQQP